MLAMISSTSVPICKRFHARQANSTKSPIFKRVPVFDTRVAGLVERIILGPRPLKATFNAENFMYRLSWSISRHFGAINS